MDGPPIAAPHVFIARRSIGEAAVEAGRALPKPEEEEPVVTTTPADRRRTRQRRAAADYWR
jgi:hypothetical protein